MEVRLICDGIDGERGCFLVEANGKKMEIINCDLTDTNFLGKIETYHGLYVDDNRVNHTVFLTINKVINKVFLEIKT